MQITLTNPTVRDLVADYMNDAINGVRGFGDDLDIRPRYQREFVYSPKQQAEVIHTVMRGLPLNVMYWVDRGAQFDSDPETPRYEVMDGQQRTISICEYVEGAFAVDVPGFGSMFFANLRRHRLREADLVPHHQHRRREAYRPGASKRRPCRPLGIRRQTTLLQAPRPRRAGRGRLPEGLRDPSRLLGDRDPLASRSRGRL